MWYASFHYRNTRGERLHKTKRGFKTEVEARLFEEKFLEEYGENMDMTFERFMEHYYEDITPRIRENTSQGAGISLMDGTIPMPHHHSSMQQRFV